MQSIIETALSFYGIREILGKENNPEIVNLFTVLNKDWNLSDETSWCCAFVKAIFKMHNIDLGDRLDARSLLDYGVQIEPRKFELGDVAIFWRGESSHELIEGTSLYKGHVGFPVNKIDNYYYILGGNQNNQVKVSPYPDFKLLQIRRI